MADAVYEYGSRFSPRCFRRGATQELKVDRSGDTQIKGAGRWGAMGFRAYSDTQLTDALEISRLVAKATTSDSEDDTGAPANVAFSESPRKRLRPFPARELVYGGPSILTVGTGFRGRSISRVVIRVRRRKASSYPENTPRGHMPADPLTDVGSGVWG